MDPFVIWILDQCVLCPVEHKLYILPLFVFRILRFKYLADTLTVNWTAFFKFLSLD